MIAYAVAFRPVLPQRSIIAACLPHWYNPTKLYSLVPGAGARTGHVYHGRATSVESRRLHPMWPFFFVPD